MAEVEQPEEEEEGWMTLTDLGERLLIPEGCTSVLLYNQKEGCFFRGAREPERSSQHCRMSVRSSRINIDSLFPLISPPFCLGTGLRSRNLRNIAL